MADKKISELDAIGTLAVVDVLPVVDDTDSTTKKATIQQIVDLVPIPELLVISTPLVAYIETDGNDTTAEVGNPAKPFETAQAAYDALDGDGTGSGVLQFGVGTFGNIFMPAQDYYRWNPQIIIRGRGWPRTTLTSIQPVVGHQQTFPIDLQAFDIQIETIDCGAVLGTPGTEEAQNGGDGMDASPIIIRSDGSLKVMQTNAVGGDGGAAYDNGESPTNGGNGGNGGYVHLYDVLIYGINVSGGSLGSAAQGGIEGTPGVYGSIDVYDCKIWGNGVWLFGGGNKGGCGEVDPFNLGLSDDGGNYVIRDASQ